jgi:hypothetical protein
MYLTVLAMSQLVLGELAPPRRPGDNRRHPGGQRRSADQGFFGQSPRAVVLLQGNSVRAAQELQAEHGPPAALEIALERSWYRP